MKIDATKLLKGLVDMETRTKQAVFLYGETSGKKLEAEAKKSAKWIDRTGRARGTIEGGATRVGDKVQIHLSGNMEYSKYLECSNGKKYAVLEPTVGKNSKAIVEGLNKILK